VPLALCALVLLGVSACAGGASPATFGHSTAAVTSYQPGPGARQLTLRYIAGPSVGSATGLVGAQDASRVQVGVHYDADTASTDLSSDERQATVTLEEPVGDRVVLDEDGKPVMLVGLSPTSP
jgi:hypothetical protein